MVSQVSRRARILLVDDRVNRDAEATQMAARLAGRVDRLRDALDALGAGQPG
jgi:hypothetical protein